MKPQPTRTPRRVLHAERTRCDILELAVTLGASEGLEALTIGRLAAQVGMSKGGVFAHFGSKEALQLATVEAAYAQFLDEVAGPALQVAPGVTQLRTFLEGYFDYLRAREGRGGCFFTAASLEFDDRPGAIRERLREIVEQRDLLVRTALEAAVAAGELEPSTDVGLLAFEVTSLACGANVTHQLLRQGDALDRARRILEARLAAGARA